MTFSFLSEAVVLFTVPAVVWHLLIIRGVGGAGPASLAVTAGLGTAVTAAAFAIVRYGAFGRPLPELPWLPILSLAAAALLTWTFRDRLLGRGVPQQLLIAVQLFRPIGLIFVLEDVRGVLPSSFAQPAGWGDLVAGAVAAAVLLRYPSGPVPGGAVKLVATVGLIDFASAFFFGFASSATPLQLFAFDNPNRVLEWPLGLIPVFLVPYAVSAHLLSLVQLYRDEASAGVRPGSRLATMKG